MSVLIYRFLVDESGTTAIEYALIAVGISVAIVATVQGLGSNLNAMYASVSSGFN
jgi:pilus assembly protein Flp/PilA